MNDELVKPATDVPAKEPDKIEVLVWAKAFRDAIFLASAVSDEPTLSFKANKIGIRNMDVSEVSLVDLSLLPIEIRADAQPDWKKRVTIKARDVLKFLPKLGKKDVHEPLRFTVSDRLLTFEFGSMTLEAEGYNPERELPLPKITHTIEATIPIKDVLAFIDRAKGTTDRIAFSVGEPSSPSLSGTHVLLTAKTEDGPKMTARIEGDVKNSTTPTTDGTDPTRVVYDIGRLQYLFKAIVATKFPCAKVRWARDLPLAIETITEDGFLSATFFLASLMEDDDYTPQVPKPAPTADLTGTPSSPKEEPAPEAAEPATPAEEPTEEPEPATEQGPKKTWTCVLKYEVELEAYDDEGALEEAQDVWSEVVMNGEEAGYWEVKEKGADTTPDKTTDATLGGGNMIRLFGIVIATEEEIADMAQTIAKVDIEDLERELRIARAKLDYEVGLNIFKDRAEKAERELAKVKDDLAACKKVLEDHRKAELAKFRAQEK